MMCTWTTDPAMAGVVAFIQVFVLWSLHAISQELENPFGADVNDLNVREMNADMKRKFLILLDSSNHVLPTLQATAITDCEELRSQPLIGIQAVWDQVDPSVQDGTLLKLERLREHRRRRNSGFGWLQSGASDIGLPTHARKPPSSQGSMCSSVSARSQMNTNTRSSDKEITFVPSISHRSENNSPRAATSGDSTGSRDARLQSSQWSSVSNFASSAPVWSDTSGRSAISFATEDHDDKIDGQHTTGTRLGALCTTTGINLQERL